MPANKRVHELMIPISDYPIVYDTDSLNHAILVLKEYLAQNKGHRSLLVFSQTKKVGIDEELVGILTVGDITKTMKQFTMSYSPEEMMEIALQFDRRKTVTFYKEKFLKRGYEITVADTIKPLVHAFVRPDQSATEALYTMLKNNVQVMPVLEGTRFVGIIRAIDMLDFIGDILNASN